MRIIFTLIVAILLLSLISKVQAQTDTDSEMNAFYVALPCMNQTQAAHLTASHGTYQFFIIEGDSTQLLRTDLAEKIGVSRQTINAMEKNKYVPSTLLALKIARLFKKPVEGATAYSLTPTIKLITLLILDDLFILNKNVK